jgi:Protein of Unknown function (DUF2784)
MSRLAADAVLLVHFAFVAFVIGGFALTWIGAALSWRWVRNFWFRTLHVIAICFVAVESLLGVMCPLTTWEDALRGRTSEISFVSRWIRRVMFYQLPEWVFTIAYVVVAAAVLLTYRLVPPRPLRQTKKAP